MAPKIDSIFPAPVSGTCVM